MFSLEKNILRQLSLLEYYCTGNSETGLAIQSKPVVAILASCLAHQPLERG